MANLLGRSEQDAADLAMGGEIWGGVKYVVTQPPATYTVTLEPLVKDGRYLFIDVDAQFSGEVSLDSITTRTGEVTTFLERAVNSFLDRQRA